jgi:site-specific recombinase XerD
MRIEAAAELFFTYLERERGCSPATVVAYRGDLAALLHYLAEEGLEPSVQAVTSTILRRYVSWLSSRGYAPQTVARRLCAASSLFKYLVNYGYADFNPCGQVVLPKKIKRMPAVLTLEEARRVLRAADDNRCPWMGFRNRAMISCCYSAGCGGKSSRT